MTVWGLLLGFIKNPINYFHKFTGNPVDNGLKGGGMDRNLLRNICDTYLTICCPHSPAKLRSKRTSPPFYTMRPRNGIILVSLFVLWSLLFGHSGNTRPRKELMGTLMSHPPQMMSGEYRNIEDNCDLTAVRMKSE